MRKKEKELEDIEYIVPKNYDIKPKILGGYRTRSIYTVFNNNLNYFCNYK